MSVLEVGFVIPDTVDELLELIGKADECNYEIALFWNGRPFPWIGRDKTVSLVATQAISTPTLPRYVGEVVKLEPITFDPFSGMVNTFAVLKDGDPIVAGHMGHSYCVCEMDTFTIIISIMGVS